MKYYPIPGFNNKYFITKNGIIKNSKDMVMKCYEEEGYMKITLQLNKKKHNFCLHQLLAITFIPNPRGLPEINHINHKRNDNRLSNLEWCSRTYNNQNKKK